MRGPRRQAMEQWMEQFMKTVCKVVEPGLALSSDASLMCRSRLRAGA